LARAPVVRMVSESLCARLSWPASASASSISNCRTEASRAPAAAFATHNTWATFLVGMAASVGAGISMAFAEALSDDGSLTGRGSPVIRGVVTGGMTAIGGLGHTLPYLIPHFVTATVVSIAVVAVELAVISWIRTRYMDTPFFQASFQVVVGGVLVFLAGILIGSS